MEVWLLPDSVLCPLHADFIALEMPRDGVSRPKPWLLCVCRRNRAQHRIDTVSLCLSFAYLLREKSKVPESI